MNYMKLPTAPKKNEESKYIPSSQSANSLFKFMGQLDYLKDIIKNLAIKPRYYEEDLSYLEIEELDKIAIPMSCFCDIHLNKLMPHMELYGYYGIGLNKEWGLKKGIQPIQYINKQSPLRGDISKALHKTFSQSKEDTKIFEIYNNHLLTTIFFMKPVEGKMFRDSGYRTCNFHDEKEWRYVPSFESLDTQLPQVIREKEKMNKKSYDHFSAAIVKKKELWLEIDISEIRYLLVRSKLDREELIDFILDQQSLSDKEKYVLFSRILVVDELREDW